MFLLNRNTKFKSEVNTIPVMNAIAMLCRDRDKVFLQTEEEGGEVYLRCQEGFAEEDYLLEIEESAIIVKAGDDLGFIYGLLYISEAYMGIHPFWFWMDQEIAQMDKVEIAVQQYHPEKPVVRFRGWFFNDEVLMMKWKYNENNDEGWKMCFEALLRCGGNMTIPGTDKMSRRNRKLASDMGLWITHHHAEPLGAEMFARVYPETTPNYMEHKEMFHALWEEAVLEQKDEKVVWNLCFRGQGDSPFWAYDTTGQFDTPQKRGKMISEIIRIQSEIVKKYVREPVFCTNLYGEIMELYQQGYVELDDNIIKVRADNGYGKMVTRRQNNHNPRIDAMPDPSEKGAQGIYYHVSFYDLQAANHITMLPNPVSFVDRELSDVLEKGGKDFWIINCSNVRPHVYYLDVIRKKWFGEEVEDRTQSLEFARNYFHGSKKIASCYENYPNAMLSFGSHEDEHMGEQYYTENLRVIVNRMLVAPQKPAEPLYWIAGERPLKEQVEHVCGLCQKGLGKLKSFYQQCEVVAKQEKSELFDATLFLQSQIHYYCAKGVVLFGEAYDAYQQKNYEESFVLFGDSTACFDFVAGQLRAAEYGVWNNFYFNDCFADVKHTAYMVRKARSLVRETAEGYQHALWYHKYCYAKEDQGIYLLLVTDNHMTDEELYKVMRNKILSEKYCHDGEKVKQERL